MGIDLQSIHPGSSILDSKSKELSDDRVKEVAQMPKMIHARQAEKTFKMENSGALATSRNFNINTHKSQSSSKANAMKVEGKKIKHFNLKNKSIQITQLSKEAHRRNDKSLDKIDNINIEYQNYDKPKTQHRNRNLAMLKKNDLLGPNFIGKRHAECAMELSEASTLKRNSYHENTDPHLHENLEKKGVSNVKYRVSQTVRNK